MKHKILIVDDEPNILMSLEYAFKKQDFQVFIARDGSEALNILGHHIPDIVLLDIMMPNVDGYQTLKHIKNTIRLKAPRMHILAEVMPVYLLGDFLVKPGNKGFEITDGDITEMGSWQESGLPFYSKKVAYSQRFDVEKSENNLHLNYSEYAYDCLCGILL